MKKVLTFIIFMNIALIVSSQNYYYNKGIKIPIKINKNKCLIITDRAINKSSNTFIDSIYGLKSLSENKELNYYRVDLNKKSKQELAGKSLKESLGIVAIAPLVGDEPGVPVSDLFYVKLKNLKDTVLLNIASK